MCTPSYCRLGIAAILFLAGCTGCGGGGGGTPQPVAVRVTNAPASLTVGQSHSFVASVTGTPNQAVDWSVQEGLAGGTISTSGLYVAPSTAGTYHVVATSKADPAKAATVAVPVKPAISVSPPAPALGIGDTQVFSASVLGTTNSTVSWAVQEGSAGGSITQDGAYAAPGAAGVYHIIATSQADPTCSATATVTVQSGGGTIVIS